MKNALIQHIKQIFEALEINVGFSVYDSVKDILPSSLQNIELTHEFVVCCDATFEKNKLQSFIHKDIFETNNCYFWFEGEKIKSEEIHHESIVESPHIQPKEYLKSRTRLSSWLDSFIFNNLHAEYAPDFQRFEYNLDLQHEDNLKYLGTYFPRSYAETFCIFENLFCNVSIKSQYSTLTEVSILSVGCGTGGDIIGLLTVINKHFSSINKVNVVAVDGNEDALNILSQIVQQLKQQFPKEITLSSKQVVFDNITSIDINSSFNFIVTSKMINEIINRGKGRLDNSYYDFANAYAPLLKENGIMMLLDVTTKVGTSEFCPILLNRQINQFIHERKEYVSIIPIPCADNDNCLMQCFSQKEFTVTHSQFSNDKSRVSYRIVVKKDFLQGSQLRHQDTQYQIQPDRYCGQGSHVEDGFLLPNTILGENEENNHNEVVKTPIKPFASTQNVDKNINIQESPKEEQIADIQPQQLGEAYVIDTNAFIYAPNIIEKISEEFPIFVSAKVVDELDHRKDVTSGNDKKKAQKALKSINLAISKGRVRTIISDVRLLPADYDPRDSDNLILSVALKLRKNGYTPILVTSDNGFQVKAKSLKIKTIPYTKIRSKI